MRAGAGRTRRRARRDASRADSLGPMATLAERLGYGPDDRLLIVNCDDLGLVPRRQRRRLRGAPRRRRHQRLADGAVPVGPRGRGALPGRGRRACTSRSTPSTTSTAGARSPTPRRCSTATAASPARSSDLWDHADLDEVRRELRAQVERAILWGFDVSHLDSHMGTLQLQPEFFDIYLDLAVEFGLPIRLSGAVDRADHRLPVPPAGRRGGRGVPRPLRLRPRRRRQPPRHRAGGRRPAARGHRGLRPPGRRHARAAGAAPDWAARVDDHDLVVTDRSLRTHARPGRRQPHRLPRAPRPPARRASRRAVAQSAAVRSCNAARAARNSGSG